MLRIWQLLCCSLIWNRPKYLNPPFLLSLPPSIRPSLWTSAVCLSFIHDLYRDRRVAQFCLRCRNTHLEMKELIITAMISFAPWTSCVTAAINEDLLARLFFRPQIGSSLCVCVSLSVCLCASAHVICVPGNVCVCLCVYQKLAPGSLFLPPVLKGGLVQQDRRPPAGGHAGRLLWISISRSRTYE